MTRQEFVDEITMWEELIDFCRDHNCHYCDDIFNDDEMDDCIHDNIVDAARTEYWRDLRDKLYDIPTGYDYYYHGDGIFDWSGLDDADFMSYKDDVLEWGDIAGIWDEEVLLDTSEELDNFFDDDDLFADEEDSFEIDEPISISELIGVCNCQLQQIGNDKEAEITADNEAFTGFVTSCVSIAEGD